MSDRTLHVGSVRSTRIEAAAFKHFHENYRVLAEEHEGEA